MVGHASADPSGTSAHIMNMSRSRSTASTISTLFNPIKRKLGFKKALRGTNALYRAISAENWSLVVSICESKPYKAEKWHKAVGFFDAHRSSNILPLHQACIFHPTKEAIFNIIQSYPNALQSKETGYGRIPLHIACHSNASFDVVHELLMNYPSGSINRDVIGRVPLHYALSNSASLEIIQELMDAAGEVCGGKARGRRELCSVADFNGWLPIHVACFMGASGDILSLIAKAYPEGVDTKTRKNSTPLSLLRGINISPQKRDSLESILIRGADKNCNSPPVKYGARISPARTDMDRVVRMSDETCSKGVTLEIDEDETSSLSSMEDTTILRAGRARRPAAIDAITASRRLQYGGDHRKVEPPPGVSQAPHNTNTRLKVSLLPTHSVYGDNENNIGHGSPAGLLPIYSRSLDSSPPGSLGHPVVSPTATVQIRHTTHQQQQQQQEQQQLQGRGHSAYHIYKEETQYHREQTLKQQQQQELQHSMRNTSNSSSTRTRTQSMSSFSTGVDTNGTNSEKVVFQPITPTAVFC